MRHTDEYVLDDVEAVRALVREHPWATVVSHVPGRGLVSSHYPMLLDEDEDGTSGCTSSDSMRRW
jgi:transcriptional regulator